MKIAADRLAAWISQELDPAVRELRRHSARNVTFLLVPGIAILLWPRWRQALGVAVAGWIPTAGWNAILYLRSGDALRVVNSVRTTYAVANWRTEVFTFAGSAWVGLTLPFIVLGCMGAVRALRVGRSRIWLPVLVLHTGALAAASLTAGQGNQPRYLLLAGSILAAYSGIALAGMIEQSRRLGALACIATGLLLAWAPRMYPTSHGIWVLRNQDLRRVVDHVATLRGERDVLWVGDESAFFFPCRASIPIERYHTVARLEGDPSRTSRELGSVREAVACVHRSERGQRLWTAFLEESSGEWLLQSEAPTGDYDVVRMQRIRARATPVSSAEGAQVPPPR